jgi:16S rRNA G527 N7-methylase RsmG
MREIIEKTFKNSKKTLNFDQISQFLRFFDILIRENEKITLHKKYRKRMLQKTFFRIS